MSRIADFFKDNWQNIKRRYTLKHNRAYRGKGTLEKAQAVEAHAKHGIFMLILAILGIVVALLVIESLAHGVGIGTEAQNWIHSFMRMKIPATDPRNPT